MVNNYDEWAKGGNILRNTQIHYTHYIKEIYPFWSFDSIPHWVETVQYILIAMDAQIGIIYRDQVEVGCIGLRMRHDNLL